MLTFLYSLLFYYLYIYLTLFGKTLTTRQESCLSFFIPFHSLYSFPVHLDFNISALFSLQTGEMGLTQSVGEEGMKFEVWVRQAPRTRDCITLQAKDREDRVAWTHDIAHLLWTHAINNTGTG